MSKIIVNLVRYLGQLIAEHEREPYSLVTSALLNAMADYVAAKGP